MKALATILDILCAAVCVAFIWGYPVMDKPWGEIVISIFLAGHLIMKIERRYGINQ